MSVITISRQLGSLGGRIGEAVAGRLEYMFVDKKRLEKIFSDYGLISFGSVYEEKPGFWERHDSMHLDMADFLKKVLLAIARKDNVVIVGRGSFAVLQDFANVLNVKVKAPFSMRVERIMGDHSIDWKMAEKIVIENDKTRSSFVTSYFHTYNEKIDVFDLIIDTGKIPEQLAVEWIVQAAQALDTEVAREEESLKTTSLEIDEILEHEVEKVLAL